MHQFKKISRLISAICGVSITSGERKNCEISNEI